MEGRFRGQGNNQPEKALIFLRILWYPFSLNFSVSSDSPEETQWENLPAAVIFFIFFCYFLIISFYTTVYLF
jgi:hypothetical protein